LSAEGSDFRALADRADPRATRAGQGQREYAAPADPPPRHCAARRFVVFNARRTFMM
jgi:hypothetical protein